MRATKGASARAADGGEKRTETSDPFKTRTAITPGSNTKNKLRTIKPTRNSILPGPPNKHSRLESSPSREQKSYFDRILQVLLLPFAFVLTKYKIRFNTNLLQLFRLSNIVKSNKIVQEQFSGLFYFRMKTYRLVCHDKVKQSFSHVQFWSRTIESKERGTAMMERGMAVPVTTNPNLSSSSSTSKINNSLIFAIKDQARNQDLLISDCSRTFKWCRMDRQFWKQFEVTSSFTASRRPSGTS